MESKADRQSNNVWSNKYFATAIGAMMVIFIVHHWLGVLYFKYGSKKPGNLIQGLTHLHRTARHSLDITVLGLHVGQWVLYTVYWAINLILILTKVDLGNLNFVGKRLGWVALANLVLLVFLALRNTPLAPLSARSYEKLRPLHKTAGYTCIGLSVLHAIVYLTGWSKSGSLHKMQEVDNFAGAIAGLAMVIIAFSTIGWLVRKSYEVFYMIHLVMFVLIMITVGMHRPKISTSSVVIVIFTACMWFLDRLIRAAKICWYSVGNHAIVTAMPDSALRVKLTRKISCKPGSHAFLWIPSVRLFETHPFTMVSTDPTEFLVRVYDGFTRELYDLAWKDPKRALRCSIDGGYGQVPNFMDFDRIILLAGGSGASFTFAIALSVLKQATAANTSKPIDFIWAVKHQDALSWFELELTQLRETPNVNVSIYVTGEGISSGDAMPQMMTPNELPSAAVTISDPEKSLPKTSAPRLIANGSEMQQGRPNISRHITDHISMFGLEERLGIGACGPAEMIDAAKRAVARAEGKFSTSITLHTEEFMW